MAAAQTKPKRSTANRASRTSSTDKQANSPAPAIEALEDCIENERMRLMRAHSILRCVCMAVEADDEAEDGEPGPYFPDLVGIASGLVNQTIRALDSTQLERMLSPLRTLGSRSH